MKEKSSSIRNQNHHFQNQLQQSSSKIKHHRKQLNNPEIESNTNQVDIHNRFDTEILRLKVQQHLKITSELWNLTEEELIDTMSVYEMLPYSRVNLKQLIEKKHCKLIKYAENKIYLGQTINKKKYGIGISVYKEGKVYEGEYVNNEKCGFGVQIYPNRNMYIGTFNQNKKNGKGVFFWFNLSEIPCTKTSEILIEHYKGSWWGGLPDGNGQHYKSNGDIYIGQFKNGLKHGNGSQKYANGDYYEGQFTNGLPEGYGEYFWNDGNQYKGDFKQGYRNGYGIWKNDHKDQTYRGHYMLDKKHGYGVYTWGNGYSYKGNYLEDYRHGQGKLYYEEEIVYQGSWMNGQRESGQRESDEQNEDEDTSPKNKRNIFTASKSSSKSLTQSTGFQNFKSMMLSSKQKQEGESSLQKHKKSYESNQKYKTWTKKDKVLPQKYCISFRQGPSAQKDKIAQKIKIGHRNCIPCSLKLKKSIGKSVTKERSIGKSVTKERSKSKTKSNHH